MEFVLTKLYYEIIEADNSADARKIFEEHIPTLTPVLNVRIRIEGDMDWEEYLDKNPDIKLAVSLRQISILAFRKLQKRLWDLEHRLAEANISGSRPVHRWSDAQKLRMLHLHDTDNKTIREITEIMGMSYKDTYSLYATMRRWTKKIVL